ncbi:regulatory protein RecX [Sphingosinicella sp. BN140058]|uniref:regulatory protein RecX n=1 Tax=Sphingosinicella sp. BN140058 TaxID=1892855 RepID=UPI001012D09F|nr:RecX family transcriptional regulator [Sphingosinicella sp. BN140058]QAY78300.1 RecX family transcriptional regulator [Sphingosinicella sp. BN140058]
MRQTSHKKPRPPLAEAALERLALHYVERYATTRAKLATYLARKIAERGWAGETADPIPALVERFAALSYVDDRAFAAARAASLTRRGYGERRVGQALRAAGVGDEDAEPAREEAREGAWGAALRFAEKRRIGPYAAQPPVDRAAREKAIAAMLRAGHDLGHARRIINSCPGEIPELDGC